jgi:hypothetical protein
MEGMQAPVRIDDLDSLSSCFPLGAGGTVTSNTEVLLYPLPDSTPDIDFPVLYFHSSGSTGLPKTVPYNNKSVWHYLSQGTPTIYLTPTYAYAVVRSFSRVA